MARVNGKSKRAERVARPQVGRTKPARNWQTLFGPPPADEAGAADEGSGRSKGGDAANPIARGVELGYRVMDEYVKQGARVAGLRGGGGARASEAGGAVLPQLTERMFQYASDFASVWLEAMGVMMRNGGGPGAANGATHAPANGAAHAPTNGAAANPAPRNGTAHRNGTISLAVDIASRRPVQAKVDLRSGSIDGPVVVQGLRSRDPRQPQLKGVVLEAAPDGKQLTLRLKVANSHPAGEYVGAIVDQSTGVTRGTLTVTVGERAS